MRETYTTIDYVPFHNVLGTLLNQMEEQHEDFGVADFELASGLKVRFEVKLSAVK